MGCTDDTTTLLRGAGFRVTPQRLSIALALRHSQRHMTASELLDAVRPDQPVVDISTVYRTLDALQAARLATATAMTGNESVYEWAGTTPHHHLVCAGCHAVREIGHNYLGAIEADLLRDFGFEADLQHFAIFGTCADCKGRQP